jgi:hypothetical protein
VRVRLLVTFAFAGQSVAAARQVGFSFEPIAEVDDLLLKRRHPPTPRFTFRKLRTPHAGFSLWALAEPRKAAGESGDLRASGCQPIPATAWLATSGRLSVFGEPLQSSLYRGDLIFHLADG